MLAIGLLYRFGPFRGGDYVRWFTVGAVCIILIYFSIIGHVNCLFNFASYNYVYVQINAVIRHIFFCLYLIVVLIFLGTDLNELVLSRLEAMCCSIVVQVCCKNLIYSGVVIILLLFKKSFYNFSLISLISKKS